MRALRRDGTRTLGQAEGDRTAHSGACKRTGAPKRPRWTHIHETFIEALNEKVKKGELDADVYPFNTSRKAFQSVVKFCRELKRGNRIRWLAMRHGQDAARRAALGNGHPPLFVPYAPYQAAAADFYKVDVETTLRFEHPNGTTLTSILPRWSIGACVCMEGGFPIADSLSLEKQTTTEDVLALGEAISCPPPLSQVQRRAAGGAPAATLGKAAYLSREKCAAFQATRVV